VLDSEGRVWASGDNIYGQLGLGSNTNQNLFKPVTFKGLTSGAKIVSIYAGELHSLALDSEGKLWAAGWNNGLLGLGNKINQTSFQSVTIAGLSSSAKVTSLAAGGTHSLALTNNGTIYSAGVSSGGQLGLGDMLAHSTFRPVTIKFSTSGTKIVSISAGYAHSLVLDSEGGVWATGSNEIGQLGLSGNTTRYYSFTPVLF
jgi:alpha-tubulin suppressor-like RCC1 family protein